MTFELKQCPYCTELVVTDSETQRVYTMECTHLISYSQLQSKRKEQLFSYGGSANEELEVEPEEEFFYESQAPIHGGTVTGPGNSSIHFTPPPNINVETYEPTHHQHTQSATATASANTISSDTIAAIQEANAVLDAANVPTPHAVWATNSTWDDFLEENTDVDD